MNPLRQSEKNKLKKFQLDDLARKIDEIINHLNDNSATTEECLPSPEDMDSEIFFENIIKERIVDMLFDCCPPDMENFSSMTDDQAHKVLQKFWKKINN